MVISITCNNENWLTREALYLLEMLFRTFSVATFSVEDRTLAPLDEMVLEFCCRILVRRAAVTKIPLFGAAAKYRTPWTVPSCLPNASSNSMPYHLLENI